MENENESEIQWGRYFVYKHYKELFVLAANSFI